MGDKFAVYEPIDGIFETYPTLEAAQKAARRLIEKTCDDGYVPSGYAAGKLQILQILEVSEYQVTEQKEDYDACEVEWPFDDDVNEIGVIGMVSLSR
jgi:hypothetical protein